MKRSFIISAIIVCLVLSIAALLVASSISPGSSGTGGLLSGSGAPSGSTGVDTNFYIDLASGILWGPKASGVWSNAGWKWTPFPLASWIQSTGATTAISSISLAYGSNVTSGNTLIATVEEAAFTYNILGISDTQGNTYNLTSQIVGGNNNFPRVTVYRAVANATGADTVSITGLITQNPTALVVAEVQGISGAPVVQATSVGQVGVLSVTATVAQRAFALLSCATQSTISGSGTATLRTQAGTMGGSSVWTGGIGTQNITGGFGSQAITMTGPGMSNNTACAVNVWYY